METDDDFIRNKGIKKRILLPELEEVKKKSLQKDLAKGYCVPDKNLWLYPRRLWCNLVKEATLAVEAPKVVGEQ